MTSESETGHAKNLSNFALLISYCISYDTKFNPSSPNITVSALQAKYSACDNFMKAVKLASDPFDEAVNQRQALFETLRSYITYVVAGAEACELSVRDIADIKTYARKLQGRRASKKTEQSHSASQMSFVMHMDHLEALIEFLAILPKYAPNETELTVASMRILLKNLQDSNSLVISLEPPLATARHNRNKAMYLTDIGLTELAKKVKKYVKSVFGAESPEYKQVAALKFRRYKDL